MKRKILVGLGMGLVMVIATGWWMIKTPARGVVIKRAAVPTEAVISEGNYIGQKMSFGYPLTYEMRVLADDEGVESVQLLGKQGLSAVYTVTLRKVKFGVDEDSGVKMRRVNKSVYGESEIIMGGNAGKLFRKREGMELVGFWQTEKGILTVAMTAQSNDTELEVEYKKLVESIRI